MRHTAIFSTSLIILASACASSASQDGQDRTEAKTSEPEWISLFNGVDLGGWTPKFSGYELGANHHDTFRVEDGVIKVAYDRYERFDDAFGHLFFDREFSHYRLRLEYRFTGEQCPGAPGWAFRNSGVMVHGQPAKTMGRDQDFPVSIEVQMLGGNGTDDRTTGNLCTPGTHVVMKDELRKQHCINSTSKTYHGDQWVKLEIEVRGGEIIRHLIDGAVVLEYTQPQLDENDADGKRLIEAREGKTELTGGTISLQAEGHPCEFRNIELMLLEE